MPSAWAATSKLRWKTGSRHDDVGLQTDQLLHLRWDAANIAFGVADLELVILALDIAKLAHSLGESAEKTVDTVLDPPT